MRNLFYLLAFFVVAQSCSPKTENNNSNSLVSDSPSQIENLDAAGFKAKVDSGNGTILDVRTSGEVAQGYIANAVIIDLYNQDFIGQLSKLPRDKEVYVYCASGVRSVQAAEILQQNGFTKIYNLSDGLMTWQRNGYPLVR
jgi:rhodanese-related sulfurtransferase